MKKSEIIDLLSEIETESVNSLESLCIGLRQVGEMVKEIEADKKKFEELEKENKALKIGLTIQTHRTKELESKELYFDKLLRQETSELAGLYAEDLHSKFVKGKLKL